MKRFLTTILIVIIIAGIGGWYIYKVVLPRQIARAIITKEYPSIIPSKYQQTIKTVSDTVNEKLDHIITNSKESGITIDQLLKAIDEIKEQEVRDMVSELQTSKLTSTNQVFDIAVKHVHISAFDPEKLRPAFNKNATLNQVKKALAYIENNELMNTMDANMGRAIAKQLVEQKKDQIQNKVLNSTQ